MEKKYTIEELANIFANHAIEADKMRLIDAKKFQENYPDEELPEHFKNSFNVSHALAFMCSEIQKIKDRNYLEDLM